MAVSLNDRSSDSPNDFPNVSERAHHLLNVLINQYIQEGQPMGSRTLAKQSGLNLSAATIRNVMADLEEMGLIHAPHTSAGRVPTSLGYRFFVNHLVMSQRVSQQAIQHVMQQLKPTLDSEQDSRALIQMASRLLSSMTQLAGIVSIPKRDSQAIKQIDFVRLGENRILVVLVMQHDEVQNRIIQMERPFSADELQQASYILNDLLVGKDLRQARHLLLAAIDKDRQAMNDKMLSAMLLGEQAVISPNRQQEEACLIAGESNLMAYDDLSDIGQLRQLFVAFNQKRDVLSLLDKCTEADGVTIFIGRESGYAAFDECSVITAPYGVDEQAIGVIGVIGPKRMRYDQVIPTVDITAKLLSAALKK
ncbi:MAG TPA: heat-inducible transcription repressor HrcA [Thiothrix sp.]|nr:heat-inducible transcription repressor HrcA [Thiothrix sp.]